jgi:hypothetical protein
MELLPGETALSAVLFNQKGDAMRKTLVALAAVATLACSAVATPAQAQRGLGAAIAGGLIGGAIVGGAIAASRPAYGGPVYVEEAPPPCHWARERFWDGYEWRFRRVEVCN